MANDLPIVFACSGCSHAGKLANELAVELNQRSVAQMSCLAGIGAGKWHFLKQLADRTVWVIDGCPLECGLGVFDQIHEHIDVHVRLHDLASERTTRHLRMTNGNNFYRRFSNTSRTCREVPAKREESKSPGPAKIVRCNQSLLVRDAV